jgi:hypothetical protein
VPGIKAWFFTTSRRSDRLKKEEQF